MDVLRTVVLVVATLGSGLMAGVFALYGNSIMPGLRTVDDRTFVGAFQAMDRAIINPLFMAAFMGTLVTSGLAAGLHLGDEWSDVLPWCVAAFVLYLLVVVATVAVNVPLNDALKAAGDPDEIDDLARVRRDFDEPKWVRWNLARALATTAAFACLAWALVEHGRAID